MGENDLYKDSLKANTRTSEILEQFLCVTSKAILYAIGYTTTTDRTQKKGTLPTANVIKRFVCIFLGIQSQIKYGECALIYSEWSGIWIKNLTKKIKTEHGFVGAEL